MDIYYFGNYKHENTNFHQQFTALSPRYFPRFRKRLEKHDNQRLLLSYWGHAQ